MTKKRELCTACNHPILKGRPNCPDCDRLAEEGADDTPCAAPEPKTVSVGFYGG